METQPFQPEKIYSQATREAEIIGFSSSISPEMVRLLDLQRNEIPGNYSEGILKTIEKSPERFPQIAPEVKKFLRETTQEKLDYYDEEELRALLLTLLSTSKPAEQKEKLKENQEFLLKEEARKIKREIRTIVLIKSSLDEAKSWDCLSFFAAITPDERKEYRQWIEKSLKETGSPDRLRFLAAITSDERKEYRQWIEISLNEAPIGNCLLFLRDITPEERKEYRQWIEISLNKAISSDRLDFFAAITPEERQRQEYRQWIEISLNEAPTWSRFGFLAAITPDERKEYRQWIENYLNKAIWFDRLDFFAAITSEERKISPLVEKFSQRIVTELTSEIGDIGLRRKYFSLLFDYLGKETSSLIALKNLYIPKKKLALVLGLEFLGANPLPSLSWQLKPQEHLDLLYPLSRLAEKEENRGLFKDLILPFRPRGIEVAGFEKSLLGWIRALDFINSLGGLLNSRKILEEHLNWIKERQKEEGIETTSLEVRFSFLKEIAQELERIKTKVKDNFQQLLGLEKLDPEKFEKFIKNWQGQIESILVLAQRLHQPYPKVKKLLAQIVLAEIEGRWTESRYNLENLLTKDQLRPLIKGKNQEEIENIISVYHQGVKFVFEEKRGEEVISEKAIFSSTEELKERLKENLLTHQHFREIFKLKEFQNLTEEEKGLIERYVLSVFFEKGKIPFRTQNELYGYFENKISQETLEV